MISFCFVHSVAMLTVKKHNSGLTFRRLTSYRPIKVKKSLFTNPENRDVLAVEAATVHESEAIIGLGSNLERPLFQLKKALRYLASHRHLKLVSCSSIYETAPLGYPDQPVFMNAVAKFSTRCSAHRLLDILQAVESKHKRIRTPQQNSPRTLDLDILLFGQLICFTDRLILPHPRMLQRRFVLDPLMEISPDQFVPGKGPAAQYLRGVSDQGCARKARILLNQAL